MFIISEIIGWCACVFRAVGLLAKKANMVKYLISIGNFLWMVNGFMTCNIPLIASNAICLLIMLIEILHWDIYLMWFIDYVFLIPSMFVWQGCKNIYNRVLSFFKK